MEGRRGGEGGERQRQRASFMCCGDKEAGLKSWSWSWTDWSVWPASHPGPWWCLDPVSGWYVWVWGPAIATVPVDVCDSCYYHRPYGYPGSRLPPVSILEFKGHAIAGTMTIWVACTATWRHSDTEVQAAAKADSMVLLQLRSVLVVRCPC